MSVTTLDTDTAMAAAAAPTVSDEQLLREVLLDLDDAVLLVQPDFAIAAANARAGLIHNTGAFELIGSDFRRLISPDDRPAVESAVHTPCAGPRWTGKLKGLRNDDQTFSAHVTIRYLPLVKRGLFLIIIKDLSEIEQLTENLRQEKAHRREMFITLRNLMKAYDKEKSGIEGGISHKIATLLLPAIEKVRSETNSEIRNTYLNIINDQLLNITKGFSKELDGRFLKLTRSEIRVCQLIKEGYSSKEIAQASKLSFETVQAHRRSIRKKLGLSGRKVNLYTLLSSKPLFQSFSNR
jgi:DNA-binding NarL/FixJ family response regulator